MIKKNFHKISKKKQKNFSMLTTDTIQLETEVGLHHK